MRFFISIISGLAVGGLLIAMIRYTGNTIYLEDLTQNVHSESLSKIPAGYYRFIIISHIIGVFGAGLVTALINKKYRLYLGLLVAGIILGFTVYDNINETYPGWAKAADVTLTAFAGIIGAWIGKGRLG